jgi:hypothetical protein
MGRQRVAICEPDERRLGGLRRRHHPHDACIGALPRRRGGADFEGLAGIERAAQSRFAFPPRNRDRLPRERGLIDDGAGAGDDAIDRDDLAGAYQDGIADRHLLDRDFLDAAFAAQVRHPRRAIDQGL